MRERRNLKIRGTVQGVFFRETVSRTASRYDVHGFVRNVGLDLLEIEAEGESDIVSAFIGEVLAHPPRGAHINDVQAMSVPAQGEQGFSIAPSTR